MAELGFPADVARTARFVRYGMARWFETPRREVPGDAIRFGFVIADTDDRIVVLTPGLRRQDCRHLTVKTTSLSDYLERKLRKSKDRIPYWGRGGYSYGHVSDYTPDYTRIRVYAWVCEVRGMPRLAAALLELGRKRAHAEPHLRQMSLDQCARHDLARAELSRITSGLFSAEGPAILFMPGRRQPLTSWQDHQRRCLRLARLFPDDAAALEARRLAARITTMLEDPWPTNTRVERLILKLRDRPYSLLMPNERLEWQGPAVDELVTLGAEAVPALGRAMLRDDLTRTVITYKEMPAYVASVSLRQGLLPIVKKITGLELNRKPPEEAAIELRAWCAAQGVSL